MRFCFAGATATAGKVLLGRPRPDQSLDADGYVPFSGQASMPSGHTTMAFALATSLSDDIHNRWASVGLYGLAASVGWSRVNDQRHWLSDVHYPAPWSASPRPRSHRDGGGSSVFGRRP